MQCNQYFSGQGGPYIRLSANPRPALYGLPTHGWGSRESISEEVEARPQRTVFKAEEEGKGKGLACTTKFLFRVLDACCRCWFRSRRSGSRNRSREAAHKQMVSKPAHSSTRTGNLKRPPLIARTPVLHLSSSLPPLAVFETKAQLCRDCVS